MWREHREGNNTLSLELDMAQDGSLDHQTFDAQACE